MLTPILGCRCQRVHVCGSTNKKADQVVIRLASARAEAQQNNKRRMTAGRRGFDAWPLPSKRTPPVVCAGKSKKRISYLTTAITSISTRAPRASPFTPMALRAGRWSEK